MSRRVVSYVSPVPHQSSWGFKETPGPRVQCPAMHHRSVCSRKLISQPSFCRPVLVIGRIGDLQRNKKVEGCPQDVKPPSHTRWRRNEPTRKWKPTSKRSGVSSCSSFARQYEVERLTLKATSRRLGDWSPQLETSSWLQRQRRISGRT